MSEENDKEDDFTSLWKKKTEDKNIQSVSEDISETFKAYKELYDDLESENTVLKQKITENIELIKRSEQAIKKTRQERDSLDAAKKQLEMRYDLEISQLNEKNKYLREKLDELEKAAMGKADSVLTIKLNSLEETLKRKEDELSSKEVEISELKLKINATSLNSDITTQLISDSDSSVNKSLLENLQSELSKKKNQVLNFEKKYAELEKKNLTYIEKIEELTKENESLDSKLTEKMKESSADLLKVAESAKKLVKKPVPTQTSGKTLEILCQDLQSELNKYKRVVKKLKEENKKLKSGAKG